MDKTININLGGILFQIDEEAFHILRDYLKAINDRLTSMPGGNETIDDIEARIAEIFQSQKGLAGVITKENVEAMIKVIGKPEDIEQEDPGTRYKSAYYQKKRLFRNTSDQIVGGVCSGIADYINTDPVVIRILFVVFIAFFGAGFLIYMALWISVPAADKNQKKYSNLSHSSGQGNSDSGNQYSADIKHNETHTGTTSGVGNAINEVFRAIAKVFYVIIRVILIILGTSLVIAGSLAILCFVLIFIFKFPGIYSTESSGTSLIYAIDFLKYVAGKPALPWITILMCIVFILPMLGIIYWGVKMIFWFKARDGILNLTALIVWVMSMAVLSIICFNEGISFASTGKVTTENVMTFHPDTLYIVSNHRLADIKYEKMISLPDDKYSVYINEQNNELYIPPEISIKQSDDKMIRVEVQKRSSGRNERDARIKADELVYNCGFKGDTLNIDEYFRVPSGRKWSADIVVIHLYLPENTIVKMQNDPRKLLSRYLRCESDYKWDYNYEIKNSLWIMHDGGIETIDKNKTSRK